MTFQSGGATLDTNGNDNTLANSIGNGGAGGLTKAGSGVLTLSVSSNYLGTTVVSGGTLKLASGATLPTTTAVSLTASGATLDINGNSQTIASLTGVSGTILQLGSGSLTVGDNTSTTFAGSIAGTSDGKLIKEGTGTLELTGDISYGGDVDLNNGVLNINNNLNTILGDISGAGVLDIEGTTILNLDSLAVGSYNIGVDATLIVDGVTYAKSSDINPIGVPEPSALVLLSFAVLAAFFAARRRK
jgi:autotransporter-associated beta strand protein